MNVPRATLLVGLTAAYLSFAAAPVNSSVPRICLFRRLTGIRCPLCGLTTALGYAMRGRIGPALRLYPALPLVLLLWPIVIGVLSQGSSRPKFR